MLIYIPIFSVILSTIGKNVPENAVTYKGKPERSYF